MVTVPETGKGAWNWDDGLSFWQPNGFGSQHHRVVTTGMGRFERIKAAARRTAGHAKIFRSLPKVLQECRRRKSYYPLAQYLLELYEERGRMIKLSIDSENKQMEVEVLLKGQEKAIQVVAKNYELTESGSNVILVLKDLETNQHWANVILRTFGVTEQRFALPEKYAELIQLAL